MFVVGEVSAIALRQEGHVYITLLSTANVLQITMNIELLHGARTVGARVLQT